MTKQSAVAPESGDISMGTLPTSSDHPPATAGWRKLLKKLETGMNINTCVDAMRASSPTHVKSTPAACDKSWTDRHPSALEMFEQIAIAAKGKKIVMFLDYDGTLSPIVDDPDRAIMSDAMRSAVQDVARYFPTAIVSGRCIDKVYNFVRLAELFYAGSHGMDIKGPTKGTKSRKQVNVRLVIISHELRHHLKCRTLFILLDVHIDKQGKKSVLFQPASDFLPMIDEVYKALVEKTNFIPGANVENNKFCLSVHFRQVDEKRWNGLAEQVKSVLADYPELKLTQGRKVLEIRPTIKWDKGKALEFLLESLGFANCNNVLPLYIGDDKTDEDAFRVLRERGQGFGILVSMFPKDTSASYSLQEPTEVKEFLRRLVEWKRMTTKGLSRVYK